MRLAGGSTRFRRFYGKGCGSVVELFHLECVFISLFVVVVYLCPVIGRLGAGAEGRTEECFGVVCVIFMLLFG